MPTTLVPKVPSVWFNPAMDSWANSRSDVAAEAAPGSRDLHLDLRQTITPGTRGSRDLLLTALRDAVRSGRLAPGTILPPSRSLATDLGLARNTVAEAYAELVAEGWLASRQGSGTWVVDTGRQVVPPRPRGTPGAPMHNLTPGVPDVSAFPRRERLPASRRRGRAATPPRGARVYAAGADRGTDSGPAHRGSARTPRAARGPRGIPGPGA